VQRGRGAMNIKLDADKAKLLLDDEAVDRISAEVGEPLTKPDRDALRYDLMICNVQYIIASGPGRSGFMRRQINRLNSIQKHAKKLAQLLKDDDADLGIISREWPIGPDLLPQIVFLVETLDKKRNVKPADFARRAKALLGTSGSARQSLINALSVVYSKHFGRKAGISRNQGGVPGGPYMRFAHQALVELKIECSDETIASALHMVKS
jgi:hypothetical protein